MQRGFNLFCLQKVKFDFNVYSWILASINQTNRKCCFKYILVTVIKYPQKSRSREKGLVLIHSLREILKLSGKSRCQELETAVHIASAIKKQKW